MKLPASTFREEEGNLDELALLARSAGAEVVGRTIQQRTRIDGSTYIGAGKLEELAAEVAGRAADLVIFDDDLSPAQARNIERRLEVNVIDRTELILDIFARRARTRQARIQVEIAQLTYALPRLRRLWDHLSRQSGGIGTRGPGEKQIEVDRRRVRERISGLKRELVKIESRARERRKQRRGLFNVTIVGYTNAGKSTLLNRLAGSAVLASRGLFSTLDSTTRRVDMPNGGAMLLTDTVGFIRKLPPHLVASFHATLLDVEEADLLLHLVDAADERFEERIRVVNDVLARVLAARPGRGSGAADIPTVLVFNKLDLLPAGVAPRSARGGDAETIGISAARGEGIEALLAAVRAHAERATVEADIEVPAEDGRAVALVERTVQVLSRSVEGELIRYRARLHRGDVGRLERAVKCRVRR